MESPLPPSVRSCSDLRAIPNGDTRVGGRVVAVAGVHLSLADAFAEVAVTLSDPATCQVGDLVVVEGRALGGQVRNGRVIWSERPKRAPDAPWIDRDEPSPSETARLRSGVGEGLLARAKAYAAVRGYFAGERFVEVETPAAVPSPGLDLHLDAFGVAGARDPRFLITSPEYQMKRLLVGGVPRCFQLARCFRRGEIGHHHNPEFTMLEWYRAFAGVESVMRDTERLVRAVVSELSDGLVLKVGGHEVDLELPFEILPIGEAFARHAGIGREEAIALASNNQVGDEDRFFRLLVERVEPALAKLPHAVFVTDFPAPFASLARLKPDDTTVCERFELYVGGIELCNGFGELTDPVEQRARLERDSAARAAQGLAAYPIDERFLTAIEEGMPPSAGNAMGMDRLIALALGRERIAEVLGFPEGWV